MKKLNILYPGQRIPNQTVVNTEEVGFDSWLQSAIIPPLTAEELDVYESLREEAIAHNHEVDHALETRAMTGEEPEEKIPDHVEVPVPYQDPPIYFYTVDSTDIFED